MSFQFVLFDDYWVIAIKTQNEEDGAKQQGWETHVITCYVIRCQSLDLSVEFLILFNLK